MKKKKMKKTLQCNLKPAVKIILEYNKIVRIRREIDFYKSANREIVFKLLWQQCCSQHW